MTDDRKGTEDRYKEPVDRPRDAERSMLNEDDGPEVEGHRMRDIVERTRDAERAR
jgi:hypothetical protein